MLVTLGKLNIEFIDDLDVLDNLIAEYEKLEKAIDGSVHYKLLAGKTQSLAKGKGLLRKERSRYIHTNNVTYMVAKKMVEGIYDRILEANPDIIGSEELKARFEKNKEVSILKVVCMAKAHDIGHVAFGHEGERTINQYFEGLNSKEDKTILKEHRERFGEQYEFEQGHFLDDDKTIRRRNKVSFEHNELSALLFNQILERNGIKLSPKELEDMTLGILAHSTSRVRNYDLIKNNLCAQIVRAADKVEYRNKDYDELGGFIIPEANMQLEIKDYLQQPLDTRINITIKQLIEEAIEKGRIWESKQYSYESEPVMEKLSQFRKAYEDAIFLYDSSYSYHLINDELFPLLDNPEALQKYYDEHPGVDVFYPEAVVRELYEKTKDLESRDISGEAPSLEADEIKDDIWKATIPFKSVLQGENSERIHCVFSKILEYYHTHPELITNEVEVLITPIDNQPCKVVHYQMNSEYSTNIQRALEYISLLDDAAMIQKYKELVELRIEKGPGYGIEPVTAQDMKDAIYQSYQASVEKFKHGLPNHAKEEAESIYVQTGNTFYGERLTPIGQEIYKKYYFIRFAEYAEDQALQKRMEEEDRRLGRKDQFEDVNNIESPTREVDENYSLLARIVGKLGMAFQGLSQDIEARRRDSQTKQRNAFQAGKDGIKAKTAPNSEDDGGHGEH